MPKDKEENNLKFQIKINSKVFIGLEHIIEVDLFCNEKIEEDNNLHSDEQLKIVEKLKLNKIHLANKIKQKYKRLIEQNKRLKWKQ